MRDVKEVVQSMMNELNALTVPERGMTRAEQELYQLHVTRHTLNNALKVATGNDAERLERQCESNKQAIITRLGEYSESIRSSILPGLEEKEQQFKVARSSFEKQLQKIFEKAVKETNEESFSKLKGLVSREINTDQLSRNATKPNAWSFIVALYKADGDIQPLPVQRFNLAYNTAKNLREIKQTVSEVQDGNETRQNKIIAVATQIKENLKRYPENATEQDIQETDAHNLELLINIRNILGIPGFNPMIDILYQFYRYPNFVKSVIYYLSAFINAALMLGVVLSILVLGITSKIIGSLRTFLEGFYLNQFDESLIRKGYIHFGKELESKDGKTIDGTGASDEQYLARGKKYFMESLRDKIAEDKLDTCITSKTAISLTREAQIAIGKAGWELEHGKMSAEESDADSIYLSQFALILHDLGIHATYGLPPTTCFIVISKENCIALGKRMPIWLTLLQNDNFQLGKDHIIKLLKPGFKLQFTDTDFTEDALFKACKEQMNDFGWQHFGYVFSSLCGEFTKPLAPEDNLFKTYFLRIVRLCLALPAVLLISFPLSLAEALCKMLALTLLFVAISIKLLSATVFALPLYIYDALAWVARCCQPAPETDKDRSFKFAVMGLFETIRMYSEQKTEETQSPVRMLQT